MGRTNWSWLRVWLMHADPTHWHQISSRVATVVRFTNSSTDVATHGQSATRTLVDRVGAHKSLPADPIKPHWRPPIEQLQSPETPSLSLLASWTVAKQVDSTSINEDAAVWIPERQQAAVLDGATESYAAQRWVSIIVDQLQTLAAIDLSAAQDQFASTMETGALSWMQVEAAQRGSFTTLATVRPCRGGLRATLVGDSAILLISQRNISRAYPFNDAESFSSAPDALGSAPDLLDSGQGLLTECSWDIALTGTEDTVMLVTDAVAAWLLKDDETVRASRVHQVLSCRTETDWVELIASQRSLGEMKTDDSTAVILAIGGLS